MHRTRTGQVGWLILLLIALAVAAACTAPVLPPPVTTGEDVPGTAVAETEETPADATTEPAAETPAAAAEETTEETTEEPAAGAQETYDGLPVGFTAEGYPYRGNPDAPITVYEFSDYECPFCARHVIQTEPALKDSYLEEGDVKFVFRDLPLESLHANAIPAAIAANCVGEQGIVPYWQMHDLLFRAQAEWAGLPDAGAVFARLAEEAGADPDLYAACLADTADAKEAAVRASVAEAQALGFSGTPSFLFVNEESGEEFTLVGAQPYAAFAEYIDTIAAGGAPVDPAQAQQQAQPSPEVPYWASVEGLQPDPDNPGMTMAGDFWRGDPDAPVAVVEFSDFQCPYCRQHTLETQPVLDEQFVEPGQVFWVFKHFPVEQTHPQAVPAALAAECAGYQGKFWEMHHLLFERTEEWANSNAEEALLALGEELELDLDAYTSCQTEETTAQAVLDDLMTGSEFVRGTPTFVVLFDDQGRLIPGALPADQFSTALEQVIAEAGQ